MRAGVIETAIPRRAGDRVRFSLRLASLLLGGLLAGCTWVEMTPEAERVRIVPADRVADCRQIGTLSTYTKAKVAGVSRNDEKVKEELDTLARNEAAEMGADTIVADSEVSNGRREYVVYRCQ